MTGSMNPTAGRAPTPLMNFPTAESEVDESYGDDSETTESSSSTLLPATR